MGLSALLGLDYQGNAKTFKAWNRAKDWLHVFYICMPTNIENIEYRSLLELNLLQVNTIPKLILQNPYRILGVYANSSQKEIVGNKGKATAFIKV